MLFIQRIHRNSRNPGPCQLLLMLNCLGIIQATGRLFARRFRELSKLGRNPRLFDSPDFIHKRSTVILLIVSSLYLSLFLFSIYILSGAWSFLRFFHSNSGAIILGRSHKFTLSPANFLNFTPVNVPSIFILACSRDNF